MVRGKERDYDEFTRLKSEACEKVTKQNAKQMLEDTKNQIMKKLQKLDVQNVTEVENLYLIVAQLTQAASYVAAINKAERKGTSFDQEIGSIGLDDINPILLDAFKDHPQALNLHKINAIDNVYKPTKEAWAALHGRMEIVANATKAYNVMKVLTETLPAYKEHLENKLRENGVDIPPPEEMPVETSSMVKKMVTRYQAVLDLEEKFRVKKV